MSQEEQKNNGEKMTVEQAISAFLTKFRFLIIGIILACVVAAVICGVVVTVTESNVTKGLTEVDAITNDLSTARASLKDDALKTKEDELYTRAQAAAESANNKVTAVRSYMLMAEIQFARGNWSSARDSWLAAAKADANAYTYPLCYYQAGICCEELKEYDNAVSYLQTAADTESFPVKQRAMFNIGRIHEQSGSTDKAIAAYEALIAAYPADQWASLAKTRVLTLSIQK